MASPKEWLAQSLLRLGKALGGASLSEPRVAVLIDGDSFSPRMVGKLLGYSESSGRVVSAQLFANFAAMNGGAWAEAIKTHGIVARQHFHGRSGKNAADIALVIAALDLVHTNRADHYVVVTADSDFTRLRIGSGSQVRSFMGSDPPMVQPLSNRAAQSSSLSMNLPVECPSRLSIRRQPLRGGLSSLLMPRR